MSQTFGNMPLWLRCFALVTGIALIFQYGHFLEHILQVGAWLGGQTDSPYMTQIGMYLAHQLGGLFAGEDMARQHYIGMEMLHLVGNSIFLIGVLGLWFFFDNRYTRAALLIEGFHLVEHIVLTITAYWLNTSYGFSTLFGLPMDSYTAVAYRVWWHFLFNAIPTVLCTIALIRIYQDQWRGSANRLSVMSQAGGVGAIE